MASSVAWLDTSGEEQRRIREVLNLFATSESRDELGIGQIRDAFSDLLFPGTSVLQTRARYFLVVPWLYRAGAGRRSGPDLAAWVEQRERRLIAAMLREQHTEGLIGRVAGPNVKLLPSAIYWSGLARFGILHGGGRSDRLGGRGRESEAEELADRVRGDWHPTLPPAPDDFPDRLAGGFALTGQEASWLSERIRAAAPDRLLAHLIVSRARVDLGSAAPWLDAATADAPAQAAEVLSHAELFSLGLHGAALLYNLLVGEEYDAVGLTRVEAPVDDYRGRLDDWAGVCRDVAPRLAAWDRDRMWDVVRAVNPRIGIATAAFVDRWLDAVVDGRAAASADDAGLRALVRSREQQQKGAQARLANPQMLKTWSGEAGSGRLDYRWGSVRRLVDDIREGLDRAVA